MHLEALKAGEQTAPGQPSLTPARRLFYNLQEEVPPFLASGCKAYYYLQRYRIDCTHLLKTFSYSTFEGDWDKSRELISWMGAINGKQESYDASSSATQSLADIKDLGDLSNMSDGDLRALEEEVRNLQALMIDNPDLAMGLSEEDLAFINEASSHLDNNKEKLKGLPEVDNSFKYEEPPALDTLSYRTRQLAVLVYDIKEDFKTYKKEIDMDVFKRTLRDEFDLTVDACSDVYVELMNTFDAVKRMSLKELADKMHDVFERFSMPLYLEKRYPNGVRARYKQVERGIPNTITLETLFLTTLGIL